VTGARGYVGGSWPNAGLFCLNHYRVVLVECAFSGRYLTLTQVAQVDPTTFPLKLSEDNSKDYGPPGPLVSSLPWRYSHMLSNLRHLRLNLYLPPQHDLTLWTDKFGKQLASFVEAVDQGQKLRDFKILIGTWHKVRELGQPQLEALGTLEQMQIRGTVQVRTRSLDLDGKAVVQRLDLEHRMRNTSSTGSQLKRWKIDQPGGRHLDWEWEGGATVQ
jgi:hypothetical protein